MKSTVESDDTVAATAATGCQPTRARIESLLVYANGVTRLADDSKKDDLAWLRGLSIALKETAYYLRSLQHGSSQGEKENSTKQSAT
jgi:hypothetical protein